MSDPEFTSTSRRISIKYSGDGADLRRGIASPGREDVRVLGRLRVPDRGDAWIDAMGENR
jgi:hypothetical protein